MPDFDYIAARFRELQRPLAESKIEDGPSAELVRSVRNRCHGGNKRKYRALTADLREPLEERDVDLPADPDDAYSDVSSALNEVRRGNYEAHTSALIEWLWRKDEAEARRIIAKFVPDALAEQPAKQDSADRGPVTPPQAHSYEHEPGPPAQAKAAAATPQNGRSGRFLRRLIASVGVIALLIFGGYLLYQNKALPWQAVPGLQETAALPTEETPALGPDDPPPAEGPDATASPAEGDSLTATPDHEPDAEEEIDTPSVQPNEAGGESPTEMNIEPQPDAGEEPVEEQEAPEATREASTEGQSQPVEAPTWDEGWIYLGIKPVNDDWYKPRLDIPSDMPVSSLVGMMVTTNTTYPDLPVRTGPYWVRPNTLYPQIGMVHRPQPVRIERIRDNVTCPADTYEASTSPCVWAYVTRQ